MKSLKIFIASSSELRDDREKFVNFIYKENFKLTAQGIRLEPVHWENFLDSISGTRLQDEYNNAIAGCDMVVCLFHTKVGKFTDEEFETAYKLFRQYGRPKIWIYFKDEPVRLTDVPEIETVFAFRKKLESIGHFWSIYNSYDNLENKFDDQLDKFILESAPVGFMTTGGSIDFTSLSALGSVPGPTSISEIAADPVIGRINEYVTKKLIVSLARYHDKPNRFINTVTDWQSNPELVETIKNMVYPRYIGVVGLQLRALISIETDNRPNDRMKRYFDNTIFTAKRAVQLVCFALLSSLWDQRVNKVIDLAKTKRPSIDRFFNNATEDQLNGYAELLRDLIEIYVENSIDLPFPQLADLRTKLYSGSIFMESCSVLQQLSVRLKGSTYPEADCQKAAECLVVVLEALDFLCEYKMNSMRDIGYSRLRNENQGMYIHNYFSLECDSRSSNGDEGKVRRDGTPLTSYAVLMYKKDLRQSINLVPFVIDYNALALQGGSRICFYSYYNEFGDQSLNYRFIGDDSKVVVTKPKNHVPENDIAFNKWMAIKENREDFNFDIVFDLFNAARLYLTGVVVDIEVAEDV